MLYKVSTLSVIDEPLSAGDVLTCFPGMIVNGAELTRRAAVF